ncbi:MAG TPA: hypothetical protein VFV41_26380 [Streptosporangiaceae bacterium]|nr:hypothetical protein [Streptosporangiaceae bacterium]
MLRRARVLAAAGCAVLICALAAAPAASAGPASAANRSAVAATAAAAARASAAAARSAAASAGARSVAGGIPASAKDRFVSEVQKAWQITKGGGVTVAVLATHIDSVSGLSGKLITGPDLVPDPSGLSTDGTVLASLIAGSGPTSSQVFGTIGRAPAARILSVPVVDYGGHDAAKYQREGTWDALEARGIRYAVRHGAKVIVTFESGYPGPGTETALASAVAYAISRNVVVLGGSSVWGHRPNALQVPDDLPGVINFSGTVISGLPSPAHEPRWPANYSVVVTAPANTLVATGPGSVPYTAWGNYATIAWVAGTVALIKSVYPHIPPALVARALATSASYHPAGGYSAKRGFGLLNPQGALHAARRLLKLRRTAAPGGAVQSPAARFGAGPQPAISAAQHSTVKLAGFGGAIVAGLVLLVVALLLARRRRPATTAPPGTPPRAAA